MDNHSIQPLKSTPAHILHHLAAQPQSGKTIAAYCKEAGFSAWTFYNWRKIYGKKIPEDKRPHHQAPPLQPFPFTDLGTMCVQSRQPLLEIHFSTGTRISVYPGTTAEEVAPFLDVVSSRGMPC